MIWGTTEKFANKMKAKQGKEFDIDKLRILEKEGWEPKYVGFPKSLMPDFKFASVVKLIAQIDPRTIVYSVGSGFNCQNCGLYNRHPFCSPDSPTLVEAKEYMSRFDSAVVLISQNDGTSPWSERPTELSHVEFRPRIGFALRGAEMGTSRYLQRKMKEIEYKVRAKGFYAQSFLSGHCELCGKCPVKGMRDKADKQISCPLGGMPSLESWFVDVYRWYTHGALGKIFESNKDVLHPLKFVCDTHFTLITMLAFNENKKKQYTYWLHDNLKKRYISGGKEPYKKVSTKIKDAVAKRKAKGIPI